MFKLKKVTDLKENEVIHCPTKWEANEICRLMDEAGLEWSTGESYSDDNYWDVYEKDTCYLPFHGEYGNIELYTASKSTIHQASDFIIKGKVIEVLDLEHGQKVKAWWKSHGVDVSGWSFNGTKKNNSNTRYYGLTKYGEFWDHHSNGIENLQVIELPEEEEKKRTLSREDFQKICKVVSTQWHNILEKEFATMFAYYDEQEVSESFYKKMRSACNDGQNALLDEIFGNDEPKYKDGDWVYWESKTNKSKVLQIEDLDGRWFFHNGSGWSISRIKRLATPEEIKKATWKEGEPYFVRDYKYAGWQLMYSCKTYGHFNKNKKYTSNKCGTTWNYFQKLDINNLPEE